MAAGRPDDGRRYPAQYRALAGFIVASAAFVGANLRLLVTQAGSTGPEQALSGAFAAVAARSGRPLMVSDVVPPRASDSQALSSWFVVLSVLIPSLAAGSASALAFRRAPRAWAVAAPVAAAVVSGVVAAALADGIAGLGNYAAIAGIVALFSLAVAAPTAVLARIRPPLVALTVLVFIVFGIPASGGPANLASFTPGFLRVLSPVLPLGIAASSIRNVVYFGGHATGAYIWTLAAWALAGVAGLILVTIDSDLSGFGRTEMDEDRDARAASVAGAAKEIAAAAGTPYTFERRQESPADAILHAAGIYAAAEPASAPVIVTGRSHHVPHRVVGSVPVRLLHESPYPVLTIT